MEANNNPPPADLHPRFQPHLPITEAEMNPDPSINNKSSGKNTLLTLASLLVLVGIVGITLYLYIQNKSSKLSQMVNIDGENKNMSETTITPTPNFEKKPAELLADHGLVCKRFTSLEEALADPEIACVIDLSGKKLTEVPAELYKLKNISELDLSDNNLTEFPKQLFQLTKLKIVDLRNNRLNLVPDDIKQKIPSLQSLILDGNKLTEKDVAKYANNE